MKKEREENFISNKKKPFPVIGDGFCSFGGLPTFHNGFGGIGQNEVSVLVIRFDFDFYQPIFFRFAL